ncbi:hypothetical protein [Actinocorallia aurantiaca]|uniref:Uncharacterized protein n=1 Tax=Actinocorallia aurantiaca TaxID=46204 RepID=A0ABP6GUM4_9ACTN
MEAAEAEARAELANARHLQLKAEFEAAQNELFDACAAAVRAGSTPERLAEKVGLTAALIREKLQERGA